MNKGVLNSVGASIEDVAGSIAKSDWYAAVKPKSMQDELASYVARSPKYLNDIAQNEVRATFGTHLTDDIEAAIKQINAKNLEASIDEQFKDMGDIPESMLEMIKKRASMAIQDVNGGEVTKRMSSLERAWAIPKAYFNPEDAKVKSTRIKTAVAAYAGIAIGGRYLSGGTLTTDNYGRKDIAGVPFL